MSYKEFFDIVLQEAVICRCLNIYASYKEYMENMIDYCKFIVLYKVLVFVIYLSAIRNENLYVNKYP